MDNSPLLLLCCPLVVAAGPGGLAEASGLAGGAPGCEVRCLGSPACGPTPTLLPEFTDRGHHQDILVRCGTYCILFYQHLKYFPLSPFIVSPSMPCALPLCFTVTVLSLFLCVSLLVQCVSLHWFSAFNCVVGTWCHWCGCQWFYISAGTAIPLWQKKRLEFS